MLQTLQAVQFPTLVFNSVKSQMENPFSILETRLNRLEELLLDLKQSTTSTTPPPEADQLLTPEETATLLKVSKVTVWDWGRKGILHPRRIGNQVRYLKSEVMAASKPIRR